MPRVFRYFGFLFHFYSNDHEPKHVHVDGKGTKNKYNLESNQWESTQAKPNDLKKAEEVIQKRKNEIISKWDNHFKK